MKKLPPNLQVVLSSFPSTERSHCFAPVCQSFGDATRFAFAPLLRRQSSALRGLLHRPDRARFTYQTRSEERHSETTRKTQSA